MEIPAYDELRRAYIAAYHAGDAGAIAELFTDDCVIVPPELPAQAGKAGVKALYEAQFAAFKTTPSANAKEEVVLGDWGYGRGTRTARLMPKAGGDAVEMGGNYLNIVKRGADGGWKIRRPIWNTPTLMAMPTT